MGKDLKRWQLHGALRFVLGARTTRSVALAHYAGRHALRCVRSPQKRIHAL